MEEKQEHVDQGVSLGVEYEIEVSDKNGKVIEHRKRKSESLVKNFLMLLNAGFKTGTSVCLDTGGKSRNAGASWRQSYSRVGLGHFDKTFEGAGGGTPTAPEADDTYGIIVGTSDQAVSALDYNLIAKIAHGNAASQLYHYATPMPEPTVSGNTVRQRFERSFKNNSAGDITVKEIGLVLKTKAYSYLVVIIRDVVMPVAVPIGGKMRVLYTIKTEG